MTILPENAKKSHIKKVMQVVDFLETEESGIESSLIGECSVGARIYRHKLILHLLQVQKMLRESIGDKYA